MKKAAIAVWLASSVLLARGAIAAQARAPARPFAGRPTGPPRPTNARMQAPIDLTGYWVSVITEDWRFRMVVPARGDYAGIPINPLAKRVADSWNEQRDEAAGKQCEAYGAGAIMFIPEQLHIVWQNDNTLEVQTDAGMQTRLLYFRPQADRTAAVPSLQGSSVARWVMHRTPPAGGGGGVVEIIPPKPPPPYGSLEVTTTHMLPGLLRKNGVPYSAESTMTEYWEVDTDPTGTHYLIITSELRDPEFLEAPYIRNAIFVKEPDGSSWAPSPCTLSR